MPFEPMEVINDETAANAEFMTELQRRIKSGFDSATGIVPELLWKNANPSAEFGAENIIINTNVGYDYNLSDYDEIIIYFSENIINTEISPVLHMNRNIVGNASSDTFSEIWGSLDFNTIQNSIGVCAYKRPYYTNYNVLSFYNATWLQEGDTTLVYDNSKCIPLFLFGLKNGLKEKINN